MKMREIVGFYLAGLSLACLLIGNHATGWLQQGTPLRVGIVFWIMAVIALLISMTLMFTNFGGRE